MIIKRLQLFGAILIQNRLIAEVDAWIDKFLNEQPKPILLGKTRNLISEMEFVNDFLHILRESIEVVDEVLPELLLIRSGLQVAQCEVRLIHKGLSSYTAERRININSDSVLLELLLCRYHFIMLRFQNRIKTTDDQHRKNNLPVVAHIIYIYKAIVSDSPDKGFQRIIS